MFEDDLIELLTKHLWLFNLVKWGPRAEFMNYTTYATE